jgi:hypothetical protein
LRRKETEIFLQTGLDSAANQLEVVTEIASTRRSVSVEIIEIRAERECFWKVLPGASDYLPSPPKPRVLLSPIASLPVSRRTHIFVVTRNNL